MTTERNPNYSPRYKYLQQWDDVSCMNNGYCPGERMVGRVFEGKTAPRVTASDSANLLGQAKKHFDQIGVKCEFVKTGECELTRFLMQRFVETTAQIRIESL